MSDHTPEPWKVSVIARDRIKILGPDRPLPGRDGFYNTSIAYMFCPGEKAQAANAARVVACVNACAGIPTENLGDVKALVEVLADLFHNPWPASASPDLCDRMRAALAPFRKD